MSDRSKPPGILGLEAYLKKVSAIVLEQPALAPLAYTKAAAHVRSLAASPENTPRRLELQAIALKLDELAAAAIIPQADPIDAELVSPWGEDPAGQIPTEFDGVVADFAAAKVNEDGSPTDDLTHAALFDQHQKLRTREIAHPVQITPESSADSKNLLSNTVLVQFGGTSGSGSFTGSGGVAGAVVAQQETQLIRWDGRETEALPCTVAISPLFGGVNATYPTALTPDNTKLYSYRPFFHAFWGSGSRGQANEIYGDIGSGIQFTVHASHVYVNVGMDAFTASVHGTGAESHTYTAGAMYLTGNLGFFSGQSTAPITRTVYVDGLAASGTTTIIVPPFARTLLPPESNNLSGTTQLDFQDAGGFILYSVQFSNGGVVSPIPIADDVYKITLTNQGAVYTTYRLCFQLSV